MNFLELVHRRESTRKFRKGTVPREMLERCAEAARLAPSACNSQPWHFIIADSEDVRPQIASAVKQKLFGLNLFADDVPAFLVIVAERPNFFAQVGSFLKRKPFWLMDIGMAAEHFCLQAAEEGLGTCMLGAFDENRVKTVLNIPKRKRVALIIAVGYSETGEPRPKNRKSLPEVLSYNTYPGTF